MKIRILFLSLAAGVILSGCSKDEYVGGNASDVTTDELVPIRMGSGIATTVSKAFVTSGTEFTAGIAGWENTASETYAAAPLWNTTIQTTADAATEQVVSWADQKYYNADENTSTYMKAWYPAGTLTGTTVNFENTDGSVDALLAPAVSGSKNNKDGKVLAFAHMTAQIKFRVKAGAGLDAATKLRSITIKSVQLPTGFDLTKDIGEAVTYDEVADLSVPNIAADAVIIGDETPVGSEVMIKPITGTTFTVDVVTDKATYTDQTVTVDGENIAAGMAYDVLLTFTQSDIALTATVAGWTDKQGSAEIK